MTLRYRLRPRPVCLSMILAACMAGRPASADTILTVDTLLDDAFATACLPGVADDCSLRGAITAANGIPLPEVVTVEVPSGQYTLTIGGSGENGNQTGDLDVQRSMTLSGANVVLTDVSGGGGGGLNDRLLEVHGVSTLLVVEDLTFEESVPAADLHAVTVRKGAALRMSRVYIETSGSTTNGGGGLLVDAGASASLTDGKVWYNAGFQGAGILVDDGNLTVTGSQIRNNVATQEGGGIAVLDNAFPEVHSVTVEGSYLYHNSSAQGGGIWAGQNTDVRLIDDFFEDNQLYVGPAQWGGAIYSQGWVLVDGSTVSGGAADFGVAIFVENAGAMPKLDLVNSTVSGTSGGNAAIHLSNVQTELLHVTMVGNSPLDVYADQNSLEIGRSLFEGGCQTVNGAMITKGGFNLALDNSCWDVLPAAGDQVVADLKLRPLAFADGPTPTHVPQWGSPVVDHIAGPCPATDQRRYTRPVSDCDSGAVELVPLEMVFGDGFESGDVSAWSATVP